MDEVKFVPRHTFARTNAPALERLGDGGRCNGLFPGGPVMADINSDANLGEKKHRNECYSCFKGNFTEGS